MPLSLLMRLVVMLPLSANKLGLNNISLNIMNVIKTLDKTDMDNKFSNVDYTPKLHKSVTKARFITTTHKCSKKPLTQVAVLIQDRQNEFQRGVAMGHHDWPMRKLFEF